ncbi:hypothetical protein [Vibrio sp. 99-70-13A1]|uniref:hypothetical protein n=1 Tax=Vibrio sp. 99-70-13A1 TaxID=2607601 RepID=UPI0014939BB7|nr:hypothetical protein [Vibrio sp. 99-70-13A1]NOH97753.1 hypothetical protein [Vibrio sp. 99-70-13A1]
MLKTVSVQTLEIQAAIYPNDEIARHLNRLTEHADVLDFLSPTSAQLKSLNTKGNSILSSTLMKFSGFALTFRRYSSPRSPLNQQKLLLTLSNISIRASF